MYISKITLTNFKGFKGTHTIECKKGINFFVGNNNCGKSTVFEAIDFICSKRNKEDVITKDIKGDISVEIELVGDDIKELLEIDVNLKKYRIYLIESKVQNSLKIMRSSSEDPITQNGKPKRLSIDNVRIFNPKSKQFENPTGIDTTITALFDPQFVWADTDSNDVADFSKTKICGKIINAITKDFVNSPTWEKFKQSHKETFGEGDDSLSAILKPTEAKLKEILNEQYGETSVNFNFSLPKIENFLKSGNIVLSDNGIETASSEKGTGMQRALALSLIQVYADVVVSNPKFYDLKPIMFFIDEPETYLHPQAQNKMIEAFEKISEKSQFFIISHSPYLLKKFNKNNHSINIFSKNDKYNKVEPGNTFDLFGNYSPSWGEINYYAFGFVSVEFHNELYGFVQAKAMQESEDNYLEKNFEKYLKKNGLNQCKKYKKLNKDKTTCITLPTYIRNIIHHPENQNNSKYSDDELAKSINELIKLIKSKQNI